MKSVKFLVFIILTSFLISCTEEEKDINQLFKLEIVNNKTLFTQGETVVFSLKNLENKEIGTVTYSVNNTPIESNSYTFSDKKLGVKLVTASFRYKDQVVSLKQVVQQVAEKAYKVVHYEVINEYPHDINAYTQGLEFYKGELYESTGQYGKSSLRKVNYKTGEVLQKIDLDSNYFGEGISFLNNQLYQLTWREKVGFVYNPEDFSKVKTFNYKKSNEGWGLCNNGTQLFKSDGTHRIWTLNNQTLEEEDYIEISTNKSIIKSVNELEWVNGRIYANIYQKNGIAIINPETGAVEGVLNGGALKEKVTQHEKLDVLNGIAYNKETNTLFVTGKNWDKLFEIKIIE